MLGIYLQNHFRNTCYLEYTTETSILKLFADVLYFLTCKYSSLSKEPTTIELNGVFINSAVLKRLSEP